MKDAVMQVLKTIAWYPLALIELLRRDLDHDTRVFLFFGVASMPAMIGFAVVLWYIGPPMDFFPVYFEISVFMYLIDGVLIRYIGGLRTPS